MQLSPLQSRLMASIAASCVLLVLYLLLFPPSFALAADVDSLHNLEFARRHLPDPPPSLYEPVFSAFEQELIGRQAIDEIVLTDNVPESVPLQPGDTQVFLFQIPQAAAGTDSDDDGDVDIPLRRRQEEAPTLASVCISANTCKRPDNEGPSKTTVPAPQLTLYLSTSPDNTNPGPDVEDKSTQEFHIFDQGAIMLNLTSFELPNIYVGISAPGLVDDFTGDYEFQIAASTESCYFSFDNSFTGDITFAQSAASSAYLIADNVPRAPGGGGDFTPFVLFAQNRETDYIVAGSLFSYCALQRYAEVQAAADGGSENAATKLKKRQDAGEEEGAPGVSQRFFFDRLKENSFYWGILALDPTATGKGGTVFSATNFTTASEGGTCELIFGLEFCDDPIYPVPGNKLKFPNSDELRDFYDNFTQTAYSNFEKALMQVPCEAPPAQAYSLVRDCDDCKDAYKTWLCSVGIPRCAEASATDEWLLPRNFDKEFANETKLSEELLENNARFLGGEILGSRNRRLDEVVSPGPYKEMLPCDDVCYNLVQSCPASLGFDCPRPGMTGFNTSYWHMPRKVEGRDGDEEEDRNGRGDVVEGEEGKCNNPIVKRSGGGRLGSCPWVVVLGMVGVVLVA